MEERRFRVSSLFEWLAAAFGVGALVWVISVPVQRVIGPGVEAAPVEEPSAAPAGIPPGATSVPVMYLLDGRQIRHGELHTRLRQLLPDELLTGPVVRGEGLYGERQTRAYIVDGARFFVVCERAVPGGPMRVAAIYLP